MGPVTMKSNDVPVGTYDSDTRWGVNYGVYMEMRVPYKPFGGPTMKTPGLLHAINIGLGWQQPFRGPPIYTGPSLGQWNTIEFEEQSSVNGYQEGVIGVTICFPSWGISLKDKLSPPTA